MYQIVQNLILCILYMGTLGSEHKVVSQISQKQVGGAFRENELIQKESKVLKQVNTTHRELLMQGGYVGRCNMDTKQVILIKIEKYEINVFKFKEKELDFAILYEVRLIDYKSALQILEYDTGWIKKYLNFSDFKPIKVTKSHFWRFCRMRKKKKNRYSESVRCKELMMTLRKIFRVIHYFQKLNAKRRVVNINWNPPELMQSQLEQFNQKPYTGAVV